eukprot:scaffold250252_cov33-Tisochrysis_lutea.AAC.1
MPAAMSMTAECACSAKRLLLLGKAAPRMRMAAPPAAYQGVDFAFHPMLDSARVFICSILMVGFALSNSSAVCPGKSLLSERCRVTRCPPPATMRATSTGRWSQTKYKITQGTVNNTRSEFESGSIKPTVGRSRNKPFVVPRRAQGAKANKNGVFYD